jgi:hypothetical protein
MEHFGLVVIALMFVVCCSVLRFDSRRRHRFVLWISLLSTVSTLRIYLGYVTIYFHIILACFDPYRFQFIIHSHPAIGKYIC